MKWKGIVCCVGAGLCVTGLLFGGTALAMTGGDFAAAHQVRPFEKKEQTISAQDIQSIRLNIQDQRIQVIAGDTDDFTMTYWQYADESFTIDTVAGELQVEYAANTPWYENMVSIGEAFREPFVLTVPEEYAGDLYVSGANNSLLVQNLSKLTDCRLDTRNGSITLKDLETADLTVQTTNANLQISHVSADRAQLSTTNGSVRLEQLQVTGQLNAQTTNAAIRSTNVTAAGGTLTTTNGSMQLEGNTFTDKLEAVTSNASITARNLQSADLSFQNRNGSIRLSDVTASGTLSASSTNGSLQVERIFGAQLSLKTTNAAIRGTIRGEEDTFSILTQTTNGSSNLTNTIRTDAPHQLSAVTTNASIRLDFVS